MLISPLGEDWISCRSDRRRPNPVASNLRWMTVSSWIMKPRSLTLERLESAGNSFLLLELDNLDPSGVDGTDENEPDGDSDAEHAKLSREELLEVAPAEYVSRDVWDRGFLDRDENGDDIPIPRDARLAVRWLQGKVLLVAKGSLWNRDPATYDGRHNGMTAAQIRRTIERSLLNKG